MSPLEEVASRGLLRAGRGLLEVLGQNRASRCRVSGLHASGRPSEVKQILTELGKIFFFLYLYFFHL